MPPFVSRKREHSPGPTEPAKRTATLKAKPRRAKASLFDAADAPRPQAKSAEETKIFLDSLNRDGDSSSSLSDAESDEFEDVPPAKNRQLAPHEDEESGGEDEGDEMDWEDAMVHGQRTDSTITAEPELEINDICVTINDDGSYVEPDLQERMSSAKKGPSKRERQIRNLTHCLHVQSLLWHNTVRNSWLNDRAVQKTLVDGLPEGMNREITRWREAMGTLTKEELDHKKKLVAAKNKGKRGRKSEDKGRDWSYKAQHSEQGIPNLSGGDPLLRLLKLLTAYWRKRFIVNAPSFRKQGYMPLKRLRQEVRDWEKNRDDADEHGERIDDLYSFRELAKKCEGSRDVGGQLFVALLRGIGLETRMVSSLQPVGLGWSKAEEADEKKAKKKAEKVKTPEKQLEAEENKEPVKNGALKAGRQTQKPTRQSTRGNKISPISLDDSDDSLCEPPLDIEHNVSAVDDNEDDDLSIIDMVPALPTRESSKKYDRDLAFPTYWTEVCSPVSHKFIPVDPIVLSTIASNEELLQTFEPRGKKAERAKQVICYVVAFSADGTAKDVTVRYLKKHQLPGKTKGMRMPIEKIAIYNKRGKVKKYEKYDWFRTVMSLYDQPESKRTPADDLENQTDLKPFKPQESKEVEKESLQWYRQSADYVLEQHLRREEAIMPDAEPVKTFKAGKGDKAKEHDVYHRKDVVTCKTVESWHKEGRAIKTGQQPIKHVPMRAVTLIKKREMEEAERETGEKMKQGLYARDQTDWIIPPPIENGVIPKNAYGNMDVYVETMVPEGAVHLKLKGSAKICRKLEIDYAEACTGFEFGKQRAVPILTGVVVAKENEQMLRDAWRAEQEEIQRKEDTKRTAVALQWWRKMLMGMRIVERMRVEYAGGAEEEVNPFVGKARREGRAVVKFDDDEAGAGGGGFLLPGEEDSSRSSVADTAADDDADMGGGFLPDRDEHGSLMEDDPNEVKSSRASTPTPVTPISLQSMSKGPNCLGGGMDGDESINGVLNPASSKSARNDETKKAARKASTPTTRLPQSREVV